MFLRVLGDADLSLTCCVAVDTFRICLGDPAKLYARCLLLLLGLSTVLLFKLLGLSRELLFTLLGDDRLVQLIDFLVIFSFIFASVVNLFKLALSVLRDEELKC